MRLVLPASALAAALLLSGCAPAASATDGLNVVASTSAYGSIASAIGGNRVTVTSIIDNPDQDPHSFEGSARVELALSKADVVLENGGGYDDWADTLLKAADNPDATVLNATTLSGYPTSGEFNEHLWYDFVTMEKVATHLRDALSKEEPASAAVFARNTAAFVDTLHGFEARESALARRDGGADVAITEPVPLYLLTASGFTNVTPTAFSEAVEEGTDVSPAILSQTLALFSGHVATALVYNAQTTGPQTTAVVDAAKTAGVPVVPVTETLPTGTDYRGWMDANLTALEGLE
ncbi:zinc ABC transporter substrate-binding protein [soil metagenome]